MQESLDIKIVAAQKGANDILNLSGTKDYFLQFKNKQFEKISALFY